MAKGIRAFQALLNRVVAVPKEKVEARMEKKRAARVKQRNNPICTLQERAGLSVPLRAPEVSQAARIAAQQNTTRAAVELKTFWLPLSEANPLEDMRRAFKEIEEQSECPRWQSSSPETQSNTDTPNTESGTTE